MNVDQVLTYFDYHDYKKVRMVIYEFTTYALLCREIKEGRRKHKDTWVDLKCELRSRFILASYTSDLYNKLQHMYKGAKA
ncbi:hypothetical protein CR513_07445, partial [Mucuna pruriens]